VTDSDERPEGDREPRPGGGQGDRLDETVGDKARRRMRARREGDRGVWFGLGMFGLVGWSVAVPALLGIGLGMFLDARLGQGSGTVSWTLTGLVVGVAVGCVNAWYWVKRESDREEGP